MDIDFIDRRYFDILVLAQQMKAARERGDNYQYEALLLRMSLSYHDIFMKPTKENMLDRSFLLEALSEILPDYFKRNFDSSGNYIQ